MTAKIDGTNGVLQAYDYQTPTTGFSYTFAAGTQVLVMNPAGTLATGTITMPAAPADGMVISASSTKAITALTVNANTGQTINNAPTTLIAGGSLSFVYRASSTSWFPFNSANVASAYVGSGGQAFTANNTFTIPSGITAVKVTVVGGGGGGAYGSANAGGGGGGAGGGAAISYLTGLTPGNTLSVTIGGAGSGGTTSGAAGTGGTSTVASGTQTITTISATGGTGGNTNSYGGTGGLGSNGTINIGGGGGGVGAQYSPGTGGSSILGGGSSNTSGSTASAGRPYGGGGSAGFGSCSTSYTGGAGAAGVVIFEW